MVSVIHLDYLLEKIDLLLLLAKLYVPKRPVQSATCHQSDKQLTFMGGYGCQRLGRLEALQDLLLRVYVLFGPVLRCCSQACVDLSLTFRGALTPVDVVYQASYVVASS